jgi:hypothetical protein
MSVRSTSFGANVELSGRRGSGAEGEAVALWVVVF